MIIDPDVDSIVERALAEDIGSGDRTSQLLPEALIGKAYFLAKSDFILAGVDVAARVFKRLDPSLDVQFNKYDGASISSGEHFGQVTGPARSLLTAERTALNFMQRLSGIATFTRKVVDAVAGTKTTIVDTRKTTPGLRTLEKRAVRAGGAKNHRFGLYDGILIKDNHIAAMGGIASAIAQAQAHAHHLMKIEVEVTSLEQLQEALSAKADVILLDNMDLEKMRRAVHLTAGRALLEASGGINFSTVRAVAETGVDLISLGALTHTIKSVDISFEWIKTTLN